MTLTLLSGKSSGSAAVEKFPQTLGRNIDDAARDTAPLDGKYCCLVTEIDDRLVVHDLGTRGGTFVNGARVGQAALKAGDTLSFNGREFVVSGRPAPRRYLNGVRS